MGFSMNRESYDPNEFVPTHAFEGPRNGFIFKDGPRGLGYYQDGGAGAPRPARGGNGNFLADLEAVEARDVASPGFRPPTRQKYQQHNQPEWARVAQEGLTEAKISYGAHTLPGNGVYAGQQLPAGTRNGLGQTGGFEGRNHHLHQSQITFAQSEQRSTPDERWQTSSNAYMRGGGVHANAAAHMMRPAGGRSNLAGPSTVNGVQNPASLTSVF